MGKHILMIDLPESSRSMKFCCSLGLAAVLAPGLAPGVVRRFPPGFAFAFAWSSFLVLYRFLRVILNVIFVAS